MSTDHPSAAGDDPDEDEPEEDDPEEDKPEEDKIEEDDDPNAVRYDADEDPDPQEWLDLHQADRHDIVADHHERVGYHPEPEGPHNVHCAIHVVVENQLAMNDPPEARTTLARLRKAGVPRHRAIHALGAALAEEIHGLFTGTPGAGNEAYVARLARIDAAEWVPRKRKGRS